MGVAEKQGGMRKRGIWSGTQVVELIRIKAMRLQSETISLELTARHYNNNEAEFEAALDRIMGSKDAQAKNGLQKFRDILSDIAGKLRSFLARLTGRENAKARADVQNTLTEVEKLRDVYEKALSAGVKNAAKKAAKKSVRAQGQRGTMSYSIKEGTGREGKEENRRAFLERSNRGARKTGEVGGVAYAYKQLGFGDTSYSAEEAAKELTSIGISYFYHNGRGVFTSVLEIIKPPKSSYMLFPYLLPHWSDNRRGEYASRASFET